MQEDTPPPPSDPVPHSTWWRMEAWGGGGATPSAGWVEWTICQQLMAGENGRLFQAIVE